LSVALEPSYDLDLIQRGRQLRKFKQAFTPGELENHIRASDYRQFRTVLSASTRESLVADASALAKTLFSPPVGLKYHNRKDREICTLPTFPAILVLRKVAYNVSEVSGKVPSDRNRIITVLLGALQEEVRYRVYRLDIKRFFDSLLPAQVEEQVVSLGVSQDTRQLLSAVLNEHGSYGRPGIPTGLSVSSPLAEAVMIGFDHFLRTDPDVTFAARFVDDIVVVTTGREDPISFRVRLEAHLPPGTSFNAKKNVTLDISEKSTTLQASSSFEYLGYRFRVRDTANSSAPKNPKDVMRVVDVGLSEASLQRYKTKLCKAFRAFVNDNRFDDLLHRVLYLTSNYRLYDPRVGRKRLAGIYHNYPFLTHEAGSSLHLLDETLADLVHNSQALRAANGTLLSAQQRALLARRSFVSGHRCKQYYSFSVKTLARIKRCWFDG
jgi:Reverse transcriptase (RNA-dependent DNA polymerase)